jgi:hypothetical protein
MNITYSFKIFNHQITRLILRRCLRLLSLRFEGRRSFWRGGADEEQGSLGPSSLQLQAPRKPRCLLRQLVAEGCFICTEGRKQNPFKVKKAKSPKEAAAKAEGCTEEETLFATQA